MVWKTAVALGVTGVVVMLISGAFAATTHTGRTDMPAVDCAMCHDCAAPTAQDKCLKVCPSLSMTHVTAEHSLNEAPDTIVLGQIADQYQPVQFDHRKHANMAEMGLKCATCHHYSPKGRIPACRECHDGRTNPANLRQPALKGAYHRQCMSCHREWSHDTKCVLCHLPASNALTSMAPDSTDILGIPHPMITEPDKKVYRTPYEGGEVVTFYHKEHIELYGLRCVDCHQEENCSRCHDLARFEKGGGAAFAASPEDVHATCNTCHSRDGCSTCHDSKEKPPFAHANVGWELNKFHDRLGCRACHPTGRTISKLATECISCHAGWDRSNFEHTVTGLQLDETHAEVDCADCHDGLKFDGDPQCRGCHDDGRTPRDAPPGTYIISSTNGRR